MGGLCDVNWLVALCHRAHQHHRVAKDWLEAGGGDEGLAVCRVTQLGMLRLLTNPVIMKGEVCTTDEAWVAYDQMMSDPRFGYRDEPPGLSGKLLDFTRNFSFSPQLWQDAYLAAFALAAGLRLITFDRAFRKFKGLDCVVLAPK
jgi:uncharacterized protein